MKHELKERLHSYFNEKYLDGTLDTEGLSLLKLLEMSLKEFDVIYLERDDLDWKGFAGAKQDDDTMERIASGLSDSLLNNYFYQYLEDVAEDMGIERKEDDDECE